MSVSEIEKLGFKVQSEEGISYLLVDVKVSLKNAKFIEGTDTRFTYRHLA